MTLVLYGIMRSTMYPGHFRAMEDLMTVRNCFYECIYNTSEYMFSTLKPGVPLLDVDKIIRKYTFEQLKEAGVCKKF